MNSYLLPCCLTTCLYFATFKTDKRLELTPFRVLVFHSPLRGCSRIVPVKSHCAVKAGMAELCFQEQLICHGTMGFNS